MSYFDYYRNNNKPKRGTIDTAIQGTCCSMCPSEEIVTREREKMVHILEVAGSSRRLVKSYSRSAADSNMAVPRLLRPYPVLRVTLHYLLLEVTKRSDVPVSVVYDFVSDRLRAVRQDATIQSLPAEQCVVLLEPMVRFYVYYGYKLCQHPLKDYDPVMNKKYLLECLKWYLSCCDSIEKRRTDKSVDSLSRSLSNFNIRSDNRNQLKSDRVLMESLYILCNLDDVHPIYRYLSLPSEMKRLQILQLAYNIAIENMKGNYIQVFRQAQNLCPLTYCAFALYIPVIQRKWLRVLSIAYNSKQLSVPCDVIRRWFALEADAQALALCAHYGVRTEGNKLMFVKGQFNEDALLLPPSRRQNDKKLDVSIDTIFTYNNRL